MQSRTRILGILTAGAALWLGACVSQEPAGDPPGDMQASSPPSQNAANDPPTQFTQSPRPTPPISPGLYVNGTAFRAADLQPALYEAAGPQVVADLVLDQMIARALAEKKITPTPDSAREEEQRLLSALDENADTATRLLRELRQRQGLGDVRYAQMLSRNAGLRALVRDEAVVSDTALREAFEIRHGARYELRLATTDTLPQCSELVRKARAGAAFADLAVALSTDLPSRDRGGLLSPVSPADANYPAALRQAMVKLNPGDVSDPIALERGFAAVKLERIVPADGKKFEDAKASLEPRVRLQVERLLMDQLARSLLRQADVVALDAQIAKAWAEQKRRMGETR